MRATVLGETPISRIRLNPDIVSSLSDTARKIRRKSTLVWAEHCTECAMPSCYASCSLYTPRRDLKCRRLVDGLEQLRADGSNVQVVRASFRRWGKLEAQGRLSTYSRMAVGLLERSDRLASRLLEFPVMPFRLRRSASFAWNRAKAKLLRYLSPGRAPDMLLVETIGEAATDILITVRNSGAETGTFYQEKLSIAPGYNRNLIPVSDIRRYVSPDRDILLSIEPASARERPTLLFGAIDFVSLDEPIAAAKPVAAAAAPGTKVPKVKCVVWDLDNTLWQGTLVEDGADALTLNPAAARMIAALDERGILNSIASKNSFEDVEPVLRKFGLWDYFLAPQIHWDRKSSSIAAIAESLNIGRDSLVLIDDQRFERAEVAAAHPEVETFDVTALEALLDGARFDVPSTEESRKRRLMYKQEEVRQQAGCQSQTDFLGFLRSCDIVLTVSDLSAANIARVFELTERTNQLNYVARKMSRLELEAVERQEGGARGLVLSVTDRYGDYGIVGFALLDMSTWTVESFFMSCRVQRKKVDHAFFDLLRRHAARAGRPGYSIAYRPSRRNEPSRVVLEDEMQLAWRAIEGDTRAFDVDISAAILESDIVRVDDRSGLTAAVSEPADAG